MKNKQLCILGLAVAIGGSSITGNVLKVSAMDNAQNTVVQQETGETETLVSDELASVEQEETTVENNDNTAGTEETKDEAQEENAKTPESDQKEKPEEVKGTEEAIGQENKALDEGTSQTAQEKAVDKSELLEVIEVAEYELNNEARYTPDSFQNFKSVLDEARGVRDNSAATAEEVSTVTQKLKTAYQSLVYTSSGYSEYIQDIIDQAESQMIGELLCTPDSWRAYQAAKANMVALKNNPDAYSQEQADAIIGAFLDAFSKVAMIPENTDKTELWKAIKGVQNIVQNSPLYTSATVAAANAVLNSFDASEDAIAALDSYETQQLFRRLADVLSTAELSVDGLKSQVNVLKNAINELRASGVYNEAVLAGLEARLTTAEALLNAPDITVEQVTQISTEVQSIRSELENMEMDAESVKNLLQNLIGDVEYQEIYDEIKGGSKKYEEFSRLFFTESYETAKALINSTDMAEAEAYFTAFMNLTFAKEGLMETPDSGEAMLKDLDTIIEQEKDQVGKPGGIKEEYMEQLLQIKQELETALEDTPEDYELLEKLINKARETIMAANKDRIPAQEKPSTPDKEPSANQNTNVSTTTTVTYKEESEKRRANKNPQTGDPAAMLSVMGMMMGSAAVALKMRKKGDKKEDNN